jgi:hypothetical protein
MSKLLFDYLNVQQVQSTYNTGSIINNGSSITLPNPQINIPKSLSYDFRVAEYVNDKDEIVKVGLQVAVFEHDNYGVRQLRQDFVDVERVKIKL